MYNLKKIIYLLSGSLLFCSCKTQDKWEVLLDNKLTHWEIYQSFKHENNFNGTGPMDSNGILKKPIGYNKNVNNTFSMIEEDGEDVLRISGEIYGCVFTKKEYQNYHLKLQVKWGDKKWVPRLEEERDSGILYHSQGECGVDYWKSWMLSQEFQIIENSSGDYWCIANSRADIRSRPYHDSFIYDEKGELAAFGVDTKNWNFCKAKDDFEKPKGEWNTMELICYEDKSLHIVNGKVAMALTNSRFLENGVEKPLIKGKIQLQSEAAEVYFKDVKIKSISQIPETYQDYF